jgi:ubiquinone/menaquinone biosynthesis C-methylase UbiE
MEFTGERYIPSLDGQIKHEHLHRYALCLEFVAGKSVLDIASGEGYGSALLARVAESVVGVDIIPEVIEYAAKQYKKYQNLNFLVGSCDSIPLPNHSLDVVTSFETIEHHDKHEEMMLEIKRVLKPEGILIISSPNRLTYSDEANYSNPFHMKELYYNELISLLGSHFKYTKIYGQRLATGSFIFPIEDTDEKYLTAYKGNVNNLNQQVCSLKSPIYFVAICSDQLSRIQTPISSIYIDESDDLLQAHFQAQIEPIQAQLQRSQLEWQETQKLLQQAQREWKQTQDIIQAMETSKFWRLRQVWFQFKRAIGLGF